MTVIAIFILMIFEPIGIKAYKYNLFITVEQVSSLM